MTGDATTKNQVDLLPDEPQQRGGIGGRVAFWAVVAAAVVAAEAMVAVALNDAVRTQEEAVAPLRNLVGDVTESEARLRSALTELSRAHSREQHAHAEWRRRRTLFVEPAWSALLSELGGARGERAWITEVTLLRPDLASNQQANLTVAGRAASHRDAMAFVARIARSKHVETFTLSESRVAEGQGAGGPEFRAEGTVRPQ